MKSFIQLVLVSIIALSSTYASCRLEAELQSMDILAQELAVSYDEVYNEYQTNISFNGLNEEGLDLYSAYFNTYSGAYKLETVIDERCDVVSFELSLL
ncbi:hypothetical protein [Halobacteriovorax sp. DA5]|uniref:hypothetical protein n=1 Tax=Halobacteriovorax sp. DA5 TaxID=2067553 RepID=UPI000CD25BE1|nr:hypothetical protein [Halobacteriovorax sp. DA5]POB12558.1 hypothetical protein C0Z22_14630 [Halobacteriovorax sp. DA5]